MAVPRSTVTTKDLLLNHLEYTFEKEAWQPPLAAAVEGLTAAQAAWKPAPDRHSIWQIVRHVILWKQATLDAWEGTSPVLRDGAPTEHVREIARSDWQEVCGDDAAWQADLSALHGVSRAFVVRVNALPEETLLRPFEGEDMPAVLRLLRMATHDIYHAGQIRYIRTLQGA